MDLSLVRVFVSIYEARGITAAAERLFVTPPAVSQALTKLRQQLDDPLFERVGRIMEPTHAAHALYPELRSALLTIDRAVDGLHGFDPAESDRRLTIALSELGEIGWLPAILRAVRARAPRMRLEVIPARPDHLPEQLSRGSIDLAITPAALPSAFESTVIKRQGYGVVMSADNQLAQGPLTCERYATATHLRVSGDSGIGQLDSALARAGIALTPHIVVHRIAALPVALADDPALVATVPDTIAEGWAATWPLTVRPLPFAMEPVAVRLYRRHTTQHSAALDWFATTVSRAISGLSGQFSVIHGDG